MNSPDTKLSESSLCRQSEEYSIPSNFLKYLLFTPSLLRLGGSVILAALVTLSLGYVSYFNYWKRTIFRTQTVDFNILVNTLPTKLSMHLIDNNIEELQRTLDSNYGLFGIVVTNCQLAEPECPEQEIIYLSSGEVIKTAPADKIFKPKGINLENWQLKLSKENLKGQLYVPLRNPPSLTPEWEFKSPFDTETKPTGDINPGKIIGRVYFIRNSPPVFIDDLGRWLKNPLSNSSATLLYNSIALATLFTSLLVWLILELRYHKASLAEQRAVRAEKATLLSRAEKSEAENKALEAENRAVSAEKAILINRAEKSEAENRALEAENRAVSAENRALEAENKAIRLQRFWDGFQESFDQDFASVLANRLEELRGFFRRLDTDIDNIVHDMRKAPLLGIQMDVRNQIVNKLQQQFFLLNDSEKDKIIKSIIEFIGNTDNTIESIDWVLKDLREVANINATDVQVQSVIHNLLNNKPPHVNLDWLKVEFEDKATSELWILCNEWHLKSIIKNVLYNCAAALSRYQVDLFMEEIEFQGKILITCFEEEGKVCIRIVDNGPGYPESIINRLYQTQEKLNQDSRRGRGNLIVYSYLQLHSGEARIENLSTGGGQVTFYFPKISPLVQS
jgi:signal transduction histidine kinase